MLWTRVVTTFYRRAILLVRDLESADAFEARVPARIAPVPPQELEEYRRLRPGTAPREVEARLARGHTLVGAWVDGRMVHAAWVATGRAHLAYLGRDVMLEPEELLVYDSYTLDAFRQSGIARARMSQVFREYRARGFRRCLAIVAVENAIGRRAMESAGYRVAGRYGCVRLGPWNRCWRDESSEALTPPLLPPLPR